MITYNVFIVGSLGTGKTTITHLLENALVKLSFKVKSIYAGSLLVNEAKKGTPLGDRIWALISKSHSVPSQIVWKLLSKQITDSEGKFNVRIFEGVPRSIEHLNDPAFSNFIKKSKGYFILLQGLNLTSTHARLVNRKICQACGGFFIDRCIMCEGLDYEIRPIVKFKRRWLWESRVYNDPVWKRFEEGLIKRGRYLKLNVLTTSLNETLNRVFEWLLDGKL